MRGIIFISNYVYIVLQSSVFRDYVCPVNVWSIENNMSLKRAYREKVDLGGRDLSIRGTTGTGFWKDKMSIYRCWA